MSQAVESRGSLIRMPFGPQGRRCSKGIFAKGILLAEVHLVFPFPAERSSRAPRRPDQSRNVLGKDHHKTLFPPREWGARLRGRTATQRFKIRVLRRFWKGFWGRVLLRRVLRRGSAVGFTVGKGSEKGSQRGSEKGVSSRFLERPLEEYAPLGVRTRGGPP